MRLAARFRKLGKSNLDRGQPVENRALNVLIYQCSVLLKYQLERYLPGLRQSEKTGELLSFILNVESFLSNDMAGKSLLSRCLETSYLILQKSQTFSFRSSSSHVSSIWKLELQKSMCSHLPQRREELPVLGDRRGISSFSSKRIAKSLSTGYDQWSDS